MEELTPRPSTRATAAFLEIFVRVFQPAECTFVGGNAVVEEVAITTSMFTSLTGQDLCLESKATV
jgi:hypothetical protein